MSADQTTLPKERVAPEKRAQRAFLDLARRFRAASNPDDIKRLGDELGRMVFGG
jgi:hypothetical protein